MPVWNNYNQSQLTRNFREEFWSKKKFIWNVQRPFWFGIRIRHPAIQPPLSLWFEAFEKIPFLSNEKIVKQIPFLIVIMKYKFDLSLNNKHVYLTMRANLKLNNSVKKCSCAPNHILLAMQFWTKTMYFNFTLSFSLKENKL